MTPREKSSKKIQHAASPRKRSSSKHPEALEPSLPSDVELYRTMLLIRRFEEKAGQLYGMLLIGGFCHLYIGQEAVVTGVQAVLRQGDTSVTSYRDHGHMLACGASPEAVMAELTGRQAGTSKGKGGSMHMFAPEQGFYGGHGIVGAQVSIGTGLGFAHQYRQDGGLCVTYLGDGAVNQGQVYESFNMAALWKLPVLYVIENNRYGMGTSVQRAAAGDALSQRGAAYQIPGEQADGMDVHAVMTATQEATAHIRGGGGPFILELMTYRYRGHSMSDPAKYRTREEVQKMREESDPIERLKGKLLRNGTTDEESLKGTDKAIRAQVNAAADFAQKTPEPPLDELYRDVFA